MVEVAAADAAGAAIATDARDGAADLPRLRPSMTSGGSRSRLRSGCVVWLAMAGATAAWAVEIAPHEARQHIGEIVTVVGEVTGAETAGDTCTLTFGPEPDGLRVVLLLPVLTDLPEHPERLYRDRRIRATGRIQQFKGIPEMVLRGAARVEVIGFSASAPSMPASSSTSTTIPLRAAPASPAAAIAALAEERCARARTRWRDASTVAREHATALTRCLEGTGYRCRTESEALAPALAALEWAEQQVEAACE